MAETFEQSLRRMMASLGNLIEHVIGRVKQAKVQVESRGGVQPVLALESQLDASRIRELIDASTQKILANTFPDLKGHAVLEIGERCSTFAPILLAAQAGTVTSVELGVETASPQGDVTRGFMVRAQPHRLPFIGNRFAYVLGRLATPLQGDFATSIQEIGRVMAHGGQGIIVDYHPFGLFAKRGANRLRPAESGIRHFEDYYRLARNASLRVVDVREAFITEELRTLFQEAEIPTYRAIKGTPLLTFFFVYKPKRGTE